MTLNKSFAKLLATSEGQRLAELARRRRQELIDEAREGRPPVAILADDLKAIWPEIAVPSKPADEKKAEKRRRFRLRQFAGAVVGAELREAGFEVKRAGTRISLKSKGRSVFDVGTTFRPAPDARDTTPQSHEAISSRFAGYISRRERLLTVMTPWLQRGGTLPLSELVEAANVALPRHFFGVASALARNMKKAGWTKGWYRVHERDGERIYEIVPELIAPLKSAFGL